MEMLMDKKAFEIPYRFDNQDDIKEALKDNFLNLGNKYRVMLSVANKKRLEIPLALQNSKREVVKEFGMFIEHKLRERNVRYEEINNLRPVESFGLIQKKIPWIDEVLGHNNFLSFLYSLPANITDMFGINRPYSESMVGSFESVVAVRKLIGNEVLAYVRRKKPKYMTTDELKKILVGFTLFSCPDNDDLLFVLENHMENPTESIAYQNAMAELLFMRVPETVQAFTAVNVKTIKQKLASRVMKLTENPHIKIALLAPVTVANMSKDLISVLEKVSSLAKKINNPEVIKNKLHPYIESMILNLSKRQAVYKELFLDKELEKLKRLYVPRKIVEARVTYQETIIRKYTVIEKLRFFPTKDYLDLCKGIFSRDCTRDHFAEQHLLTSNFFNVRIFKKDNWIGNMYMLDFTEECGLLLIDRIQIPGDINMKCMNFFDNLKDILAEMFEAVKYKEILISSTVSNHKTIQTAFNSYRKNLKKKSGHLLPELSHFESLEGKTTLYILIDKKLQ